jgi:histidinol dehydrogenase
MSALPILDWGALDAGRREAALRRAPRLHDAALRDGVAQILAQVRADGDRALRDLGERFDGCRLADFCVSAEEFAAAEQALPGAVRAAIDEARARIEMFHRAGMPAPVRVETAGGVTCERILRPIARVGLYVPAGSAPLPSTALMLGVPAMLAQCPQALMCTPPRADGSCDPAVLYAASRCGIAQVFKLGGAQAIAALAFGTGSVAACDKIFGPGNAWVTEAKRQVAAAIDGPAIDMLAGPSEVLVIADAQADPAFVAADLLAQAEHGPDSQAILLTDSAALARSVAAELADQIQSLPRAAIAATSLAHARLIFTDSLDTALAISNTYAPEHLILNIATPRERLAQVENAGSVFLGAWSPEAVGDYCSGTNHVLPTGGQARRASGVSVASFMKQVTVQELTRPGLRRIGPCAATLARTEGLAAHERAVTRRLAAMEACA